MAIEVFAPAKINLTLHVTGQRDDGYHLLDSLVVFADFGDFLTVAPSDEMEMTVSGPFAKGVPTDHRNLCWKAAELFGESVSIHLTKNLPHAAGIGGGSSDAAAVLNAMTLLFDRPCVGDPVSLGADVPVCQVGKAVRMQGVGEVLTPLDFEPICAVLVNPRVEVPTPVVFKGLACKTNPMMSVPPKTGTRGWLTEQRNDLEGPAIAAAPVIHEVLQALSQLEGVRLVRMSGSGATCFGVFDNRSHAEAMARQLAKAHPDWWVRDVTLS